MKKDDRTKTLEDVFFSSSDISQIQKCIDECDEIIFQHEWFDVILDPIIINKFIDDYEFSRKSKAITVVNPHYNKNILYHELIKYIESEAFFQRKFPYDRELYDLKYGDIFYYELNPIRKIIEYGM